MSTNASYENLLGEVRREGTAKEDRTGVGTHSLFGRQIRYDLSEGFPLITTKKVYTEGVLKELLWFIQGNTSSTDLEEDNVNIWKQWKDDKGLLGPIYGSQLVSWYAPGENVVSVPVKESTRYTGDGETPEDKQILGVGFFDKDIDVAETKSDIFRLWCIMLWSCYDEEYYNFANYGAKGFEVSDFWLNYDNFKKTIHLVPGFYRWKKNSRLVLDPSYFGSQVFAPDTTVFASQDYIKAMETVSPIEVSGVVYASVEDYDSVYGFKAVEAWENGEDFHGIPAQDFKRLDDVEGHVWRKQLVINQLDNLVKGIKDNPSSRRHVVSFWNPADLEDMALAPCHMIFQVYINDGKLSLHVYQRSADLFLGVPFNIASYAFLTHMLAAQTGYEVGDLVWTGGDVHIYDNHAEVVDEQLSRDVKQFPQLSMNPSIESIFDYTVSDFRIDGYDPHPALKAEVAV